MKISELYEVAAKRRDPKFERLEDEYVILQGQFKKLKAFDPDMFKKFSAQWEEASRQFSSANVDSNYEDMVRNLDKLNDISENWANR